MRILTRDWHTSLTECRAQPSRSVGVRNEYRHFTKPDTRARIIHDVAQKLAGRIRRTERGVETPCIAWSIRSIDQHQALRTFKLGQGIPQRYVGVRLGVRHNQDAVFANHFRNHRLARTH